MQICIHRKDNPPKPVNHHLTLKDNIRIFPAHDILHAGFTLQTSRINNKRVISTFKVLLSSFDLEGGAKGQIRTHQKIPCP